MSPLGKSMQSRSYIHYSPLKIPENFNNWLLEIVNNEEILQSKNVHLWKYFTRLLQQTTHLNIPLLHTLGYHRGFLSFINGLLDYGYENDNEVKVILERMLEICVEVSIELDTDDISPGFNRLALRFLKDKNYICGALEIILNSINSKNDGGGELEDAQYADIFPVKLIRDSFFALDANDLNFSKFIKFFIKFCSLSPFHKLNVELILHDGFNPRMMEFFQIYFNSLLIQIDLLKFIKLIVTNSLPCKQIDDNLNEMIAFLKHNWDAKRGEYKEGKVGNDSILIHQLCSDIEMLSAKHRNKKNKNRRNGRESRNVDQDGFVIPKIIPEWK